jgi:hypothetical protein
MQWEDLDEDGFGDVQMGALRDDCPDVSGTSYRDVQGCPDRDGDGWSDEYGGWNAAISIMGEDPAASWLSYLILGSTMFFASMIAHLTKMSRSAEALERGLSNPEKEQGGEFDA